MTEVKEAFNLFNAKSEIRSVFGKLIFNFKQSHPIEDFGQESQSIIKITLMEEKQIKDLEDFTYLFTELSPKDLPISAWETPWERSPGVELTFFDPILENIQKIMNKIEEKGFNTKFPLLLTAYEDTFVIDGGHHRLQAIRNLIKLGKIPPNFKVPCLVRFRKYQFHYRKVVYEDLIDYSVNFNQFLKDPMNGDFEFEFLFPRSSVIFSLKKQDNFISLTFSPYYSEMRKEEVKTTIAFIKERLGIKYEYQILELVRKKDQCQKLSLK